MLSLMEEILLLALKDEKGSISLTASAGIDSCLTGALLMELELLKRIRVDKKSLEVINRTPTKNPQLDTTLHQINSAKRSQPPHYWVRKLQSTHKHLRKNLLEELVDKALVREEERQVFLFFTQTYYPLRDIRTKKDIIDRLHRTLLRGEAPNPRTLKLIALVQACNLAGLIFDKEDLKGARKKAKELAKDDILAQAIKKVIQGSTATSVGSF